MAIISLCHGPRVSSTTICPDMTQKIGVLGATGRLGTLLQRCWSNTARPQAVFYGRRATGRILSQNSFDLLNDPAPTRFHGLTTLLVLAGPTQVSEGETALHADLAQIAARLAQQAEVPHIILMSSAAIYGRRNGPLCETHDPTPISPYGVAKARLEETAQEISKEQSVTVLRLGNVAGADALLTPALDGRDMTLDQFADGSTPRRSYIGPKTMADAFLRIAETPPAPGQPRLLNLAQPQPVEMGALLDAAAVNWTPRPAAQNALAEVVLDLSKLKKLWPDLPDTTPEKLVAEARELRP